MKYEIKKDRLWVFSPVTNVVMKVDITMKNNSAGLSGNVIAGIDLNALKEAIDYVVNRNGMLKSKVVLEEDGKAYITDMEAVNYSITESNKDWQAIKKDEERMPFDIQRGEYLRFFLIKREEVSNNTLSLGDNHTANTITLLLIAHHLAGDGLSFTYLIQDIMKALSKESIEAKPVKLMDITDFPKQSRLNFLLKLMLNSINKKWLKTGRRFTFEEFKEMNSIYWNSNATYVTTYAIAGSRYTSLTATVKDKDITINSVLTTALIKAAKECGEVARQKVGLAVSIRDKEYTGMGNYATGISIEHLYDDNRDFYENTRQVQKLIYSKMNDKKKYFLLQFMGNITGTLHDAVYFTAVAGYTNKTARSFSKMFGYNANPMGISITNLTKLPIEAAYGEYELTDFVFVPPLVLNARRIIGIASLGNRMEISYSIREDKSKEDNVQYFNKAMRILEKLIDEMIM